MRTRGKLFALLLTTNIAFLIFVLALWVHSYSYPPILTTPEIGTSVAPPHPIQLPIPSDADEYLVIFRGRFERWEYAPWERKWYRLNDDISLVPVAVTLIIFPALVLISFWANYKMSQFAKTMA